MTLAIHDYLRSIYNIGTKQYLLLRLQTMGMDTTENMGLLYNPDTEKFEAVRIWHLPRKEEQHAWTIPKAEKEGPPIEQKLCSSDASCPSRHACVIASDNTTRCIPYRSDLTSCNPHTGRWVLATPFSVKCQCKYPNLVTQAFDGGDCQVDVACQPHGHLRSLDEDPFHQGECVCGDDARSVRTTFGPSCRPREHQHRPKCYPYGVMDHHACKCADGFVDPQVFTKAYLDQFDQPFCFFDHCAVNALNPTQELYKSFMRPDGSCSCNWEYGHFPVKLKVSQFMKTEVNACASFFTESKRRDMDSFTYFYYKDFKPITFLRYTNISEEEILPEYQKYMRGKTELTVAEPDWNHSYFSHITYGRRYLDFWYKYCFYVCHPFIYKCDEHAYRTVVEVEDCENIPYPYRKDGLAEKLKEYNYCYTYPVCLYKGPDPEYHGKVILNPYMLTRDPSAFDLLRSSGVRIKVTKNHSRPVVSAFYGTKFKHFYANKGKVPNL